MYDFYKLTFKPGDVCHVRLPHGVRLSEMDADLTKRSIEGVIAQVAGFYVPVIITPYGINLSKVPCNKVHNSYKELADASRSDDTDRV